MKNKTIIILFLIIVLGIAGYFLIQSKSSTSSNNLPSQENVTKKNNVVNEEPIEPTYEYEGNLIDVTSGKTITEINIQNKATGIAKSTFEDNTYSLIATFENLPDPQGTDFYEGWIVRKGAEIDIISTGRAEKNNVTYQNVYNSNKDLTDHDFYVLTIEPDDGDPAPAEHILEGTMK